MVHIKTYRAAAFALALLFGVYNVGIPIVLASCPMATAGPVCSGCFEAGTANERINKQKDTSCCTTIIAADRNTNEFLQAKDLSIPSFQLEVFIVLPAATVILNGNIPSTNTLSHSPPVQPDFPILHSALLI